MTIDSGVYLLPLAWGLAYLVTVLVLTRRRPAPPPSPAAARRDGLRRAA